MKKNHRERGGACTYVCTYVEDINVEDINVEENNVRTKRGN